MKHGLVAMVCIGAIAIVMGGLLAGGVFDSETSALVDIDDIIEQGCTDTDETVTAATDELLATVEYDIEREFKKKVVNGKLIYYHQRMIGDAIVELDFIVYQFDDESGAEALTSERTHWREGLPETVTPVITKEQAEALCSGEIQFTCLYIISPESVVHPIKPTPANPCWVVRSLDIDGYADVTIIDAITGVVLGGGIGPPN